MERLILFTQRVEIVESYGERRDCADQRISEFIVQAGFTPVPLPNNPEVVIKLVDSVDPSGIILTGGNSLCKYGGNAPERDETDRVLIETALNKHIPLYGFCRGMQSILNYFGNKLENVSGHVAVHHRISGDYDDKNVNSYHNQACFELKSEELKCVMKSDDGVIEMIRHVNKPVIGAMWHPEREDPFLNEDLMMVRELIGGRK